MNLNDDVNKTKNYAWRKTLTEAVFRMSFSISRRLTRVSDSQIRRGSPVMGVALEDSPQRSERSC